MKKSFLILVFLAFIPLVEALHGAMPLLAVQPTEDGYKGSTAELLLEVQPGSGRVFVDTFPLSKIDTQFSMRAAKEIACQMLEHDCQRYDFIYTIRANSPIIGGPSAGAAATLLTISVIKEYPIRDDLSITGTINSGGLIGPVGGLKEKIEAGADAGLDTVIIPFTENQLLNSSDNSSLTLSEYGDTLGIKVLAVDNINEALLIATGNSMDYFDENITISEEYRDTMRQLSVDLCERNSELKQMVASNDFTNDTQKLYEDAFNLSKKGEDAFAKGQYYSAASYCFGSNVKYNQVFLHIKNFSGKKYDSLLEDLKKEILSFEKQIEKKDIKTITDLESYMIVKERLIEALQYANGTINTTDEYAYAYGNERLRSAHSWAEFFQNNGKRLNIDPESLRESCRQRIAEAEERLQYASLYVPFPLTSARDELGMAYSDLSNQEYALCLFKASKSKAESNIILNTLGVEQRFIPGLIRNKLDAATRVIVKAEKQDIFPVLGYSYFEYSQSLKDTDPFSSLLYAEYALEFSNLDVYFKEETKTLPAIDTVKMTILILGVAAGFLFGFAAENLRQKMRKKK